MPPAEAGFDTIILAGGRASRLDGVDKPALAVAGQSMLASVIAAAAQAGTRSVIVVGPARPADFAGGGGECPRGIWFVQEDPPGSGPVPALRCGLVQVSAPRVLLLAADLPFLRHGHLRLLLSAAGEDAAGEDAAAAGAGVVLADDGGRPQWLTSCWHSAALRAATARYERDSLRGLLQPLRPTAVSYRLRPGEAPPWFDCDTPGELALARSWARAGADLIREERG